MTFALVSGTDDNQVSARSRQLLYVVQGWSQLHMGQAGSIDAACDAALHGVHLSVSGWTNIWTARESDVRIEEVGKDSRPTFRAGGIYRFRLAQ